MAATVLEKQDKRLYADDTMPLCATIVQFRTVSSHVVSLSLSLQLSSPYLSVYRSTRYVFTSCSAPRMSGR